MKKIIVLLLVALFSLSAVSLYAGVSHAVYGEVFEPDGTTHPTQGTITFNSYIDIRPGEILTETSTGCGYGMPNANDGWLVVNTGNFTTPWAAGETLIVDIYWNGAGPSSNSVVLTVASFDLMTPTVTLPVELLNPLSATYMESGSTMLTWTTASESDVQGFNVYRADEDVFENSAQLNASIIPGQGTTTEPTDYEFEDLDQLNYNSTYYYWLESVDLGGETEVFEPCSYTPSEDPQAQDPEFTEDLLTVLNNPVVGNTISIQYAVNGKPTDTLVEILIYNTKGQIVDSDFTTGGEITFDSSQFSSGIYFYQIKSESFNQIKKMAIVR